MCLRYSCRACDYGLGNEPNFSQSCITGYLFFSFRTNRCLPTRQKLDANALRESQWQIKWYCWKDQGRVIHEMNFQGTNAHHRRLRRTRREEKKKHEKIRHLFAWKKTTYRLIEKDNSFCDLWNERRDDCPEPGCASG